MCHPNCLRAEDGRQETRIWALIVVGTPGDESHRSLFEKTSKIWIDWLANTLQVPLERLRVVDGRSTAVTRMAGDKQAVAQAFSELAERVGPDDTLWVLVLGHGHYDGRRAWLHLPGPDPGPTEFVSWLNGVTCREQIIWLTQTSSGWWLKPLARSNRVVITATDVDQEENETEFPHALATVMQAPARSWDVNSDNRLSLLELLAATLKEVRSRFERDQRVPTEHALLDDDGDGLGTEIETLLDANPDGRNPDTEGAAPARQRGKDGRKAAGIPLQDIPAP